MQWPKTFPFGRRDSMSLESGQKVHNLANNMNQNIQNMLSPWLVLIQHGQEWDREIELRSQEAEREERRRERQEEQQTEEAKMRAKEKAHSERLNLVMLTVLAKIGSINKEDSQLDW
ncbi:hypothetical protein O181_086825 [Austropuccinia psidii MF-1]|uniref:Uncharacterized protein n=1 Tax=Austropuccinia psidii MF-1 TaxID=1389203 RepID=A0A9Q3INI5_9BASI|nr:hypothetical protein [Austropuccinia psidii MF-1]